MNVKPLWLEYQLNRLSFYGARPMDFPRSARLLYNETDNLLAIETPRQLFPANELKRIEYSMLVNLPGVKETLRFYHPIGEGAGVRVVCNDRGEPFIAQQEGRPLFSKDFTLRDVSRGEIDSDRAVWQFHGYKHQH